MSRIVRDSFAAIRLGIPLQLDLGLGIAAGKRLSTWVSTEVANQILTVAVKKGATMIWNLGARTRLVRTLLTADTLAGKVAAARSFRSLDKVMVSCRDQWFVVRVDSSHLNRFVVVGRKLQTIDDRKIL